MGNDPYTPPPPDTISENLYERITKSGLGLDMVGVGFISCPWGTILDFVETQYKSINTATIQTEATFVT